MSPASHSSSKTGARIVISDADLETLRSINARIAALAKQLEPLSFTSLRKEREKVRAAYKANPSPANLAAIENSKGINMYSVNENIAEMRKAVKGQMRKTNAKAVPIIEAARAKARIIIVKEMEALQQTELQTAARLWHPVDAKPGLWRSAKPPRLFSGQAGDLGRLQGQS